MNELTGLQGPAEGLLLKIMIDVIKGVVPQLANKWVHLVVLVGALLLAGLLHRGSTQEYISYATMIFLSAIGSNEILKDRQGSSDKEVL